MSSKGLHWFNDGKSEVCVAECPDGWRKGRLPASDEARRRMSESCWTKRASKEELSARNARISETKSAKTEEERAEYARRVSEGRKGKGLGVEPWNKGMTGLVAHNKGVPMSEGQKLKLREAYASLSDEEKRERALKVSVANKGRSVWNKGLRCPLPRDVAVARKAKEHETKKRNGSYTRSLMEDMCYSLMSDYFGWDVERQYSDERYPYDCDFHTADDLFIEINGNWTHNDHPYGTREDDDETLAEWKSRTDSDYYANAVYTWSDLDVRKFEKAMENGLKYVVIYPSNTLDFNLSINDEEFSDLVTALYNCCNFNGARKR